MLIKHDLRKSYTITRGRPVGPTEEIGWFDRFITNEAQMIFCSPYGDDTKSGITRGLAVKTIENAFSKTTAGRPCVNIIRDGYPYPLEFTVTSAINQASERYLQLDEGETAKIKLEAKMTLSDGHVQNIHFYTITEADPLFIGGSNPLFNCYFESDYAGVTLHHALTIAASNLSYSILKYKNEADASVNYATSAALKMTVNAGTSGYINNCFFYAVNKTTGEKSEILILLKTSSSNNATFTMERCYFVNALFAGYEDPGGVPAGSGAKNTFKYLGCLFQDIDFAHRGYTDLSNNQYSILEMKYFLNRSGINYIYTDVFAPTFPDADPLQDQQTPSTNISITIENELNSDTKPLFSDIDAALDGDLNGWELHKKGKPTPDGLGKFYLDSPLAGVYPQIGTSDYWETVAASAPPGEITDIIGQHCTYNNKLYIFGGVQGGSARNFLWELDMATRTWTKLESDGHSYCSKRQRGIMVAWNGYLIIYGGYNSTHTTEPDKTVWWYHIASKTWIQKNDAPIAREYPGANIVAGKMYVFGGDDWVVGWRDDTWEYNPIGDTWTAKSATLFAVQYQCPSTVYNNRIYAAPIDTPDAMGIYNPFTDTWTLGPAMPAAKDYHFTLEYHNGWIYVVLGGNPATNTILRINADTLALPFTNMTAASQVRLSHASGIYKNELHIYGGTSAADDYVVYYLEGANAADISPLEELVEYNGIDFEKETSIDFPPKSLNLKPNFVNLIKKNDVGGNPQFEYDEMAWELSFSFGEGIHVPNEFIWSVIDILSEKGTKKLYFLGEGENIFDDASQGVFDSSDNSLSPTMLQPMVHDHWKHFWITILGLDYYIESNDSSKLYLVDAMNNGFPPDGILNFSIEFMLFATEPETLTVIQNYFTQFSKGGRWREQWDNLYQEYQYFMSELKGRSVKSLQANDD